MKLYIILGNYAELNCTLLFAIIDFQTHADLLLDLSGIFVLNGWSSMIREISQHDSEFSDDTRLQSTLALRRNLCFLTSISDRNIAALHSVNLGRINK